MRTITALLAMLSLLIPVSAEAGECTLSTISLNMGAIEHFYRDDPAVSSIYAFFPEAQASGPLFASYLHWTLAWGFWDDGIGGPLTHENKITYSFRSHILGARLMFRPRNTGENWPLPVGLFAGYSRHLVHAEYVGGLDAGGKPGHDADRHSNTIEIGLNGEFPFHGPFIFRVEARQFVPFSGDDFENPQKSRRAYTIGIGYRR